jgi:hypothetical protein
LSPEKSEQCHDAPDVEFGRRPSTITYQPSTGLQSP